MKSPKLDIASHIPRGGVLWLAICGLLALGLLSAILGYMGESAREQKRAVASLQRVVFDAQSGAQLGGGKPAKPKKAKPADAMTFDVADEETPADTANTQTEKPALTVDEPDAADLEEDGEMLVTNPPEPMGHIARTDDSLVPAPAPEISEKSDVGALPKISGENRASSMYARRFTLKESDMALAVVVTGLGFSADALSIAITLPKNIALSFSPYAPNLQKKLEAVRDAGHEAWVDIPTQTPDYPAADPGPLGFIASLPEKDTAFRLKQLLARSPGVVGGIFPPNETLSEYPKAMKLVLDEFANRGLMILFTEPKRIGTLPPIPPTLQARVANAWLATSPSSAQVNSRLAGLMDATQKEGIYRLAVEGTPHMVKLLKSWSEKLPKGSPVKLAPLSAVFVDHAAKAAKEAAEKAKAEAEKAKSASHGSGH